MSKRTYGKNEEGEFIKLKLIDFKKLLNVSQCFSNYWTFLIKIMKFYRNKKIFIAMSV